MLGICEHFLCLDPRQEYFLLFLWPWGLRLSHRTLGWLGLCITTYCLKSQCLLGWCSSYQAIVLQWSGLGNSELILIVFICSWSPEIEKSSRCCWMYWSCSESAINDCGPTEGQEQKYLSGRVKQQGPGLLRCQINLCVNPFLSWNRVYLNLQQQPGRFHQQNFICTSSNPGCSESMHPTIWWLPGIRIQNLFWTEQNGPCHWKFRFLYFLKIWHFWYFFFSKVTWNLN